MTYYSVNNRYKNDRDWKESAAKYIDSGGLRGFPFKEQAWLKDWALSFRFNINESWIVKTEAHLMNGLNDVDFGDETDPDADWMLYAVKLSYSF